MALHRYSLILRRWLWLLVIVVGCAALLSWVFVAQARPGAQPLLVVLVISLAALAWALAGVFGIEYLRDHIKTIDDVRRITSAPLLAVVVVDPGQQEAPLFELPRSEDQVYRAIVLRLLSGLGDGQGRSILVCAPHPAPQSARISAKLAVAAAGMGYSTLLVDANRQEGDLTRGLHLSGASGFAEALLTPGGDVPIHVEPSIEDLHVLPLGANTLSQPLAYADTRLRKVLDPANGNRSLVLVAGPPMGEHPDWLTLGLAKAADKVVLLAMADNTTRTMLRHTVIGMHEAQAKAGGVILIQPNASRIPRSIPATAPAKKEQPADSLPVVSAAALVLASTPDDAKQAGFMPGAQYSALDAQQELLTATSEQAISEATPDIAMAAGRPEYSREYGQEPELDPALPDQDLEPSDPPQIDLSDLELGDSSRMVEDAAPPALDLSGLDKLGDDLARDVPGGAVHSAGSSQPAEGTGSELPAPIPITSARKKKPGIPAVIPLASALEAPEFVDESQPVVQAEAVAHAEPEAIEQNEQVAPSPVPRPESPSSIAIPLAVAQSASVVSVPMSEVRPQAQVAAPEAATLMPEPAPPPLPNLPLPPAGARPQDASAGNVQSTPPRLVAFGAKWLAALSLMRGSERKQASTAGPSLGVGARVQLGAARILGVVTGRGSRNAGSAWEDYPGSPQSNDYDKETAEALAAMQTINLDEDKLLGLWLNAAEHARARGNKKQAKELIDRVLDRDPHNEKAWQLRLKLAEPEQAQQSRDERDDSAGLFPQSLRTVLPISLFALALLAGVVFFGRDQISGLFGSSSSGGQPTPTAFPMLVEVATPEFTPTTDVYEVSAPFLGLWSANKQVFGEPISPMLTEKDSDGKELTVQYFERVRLELHPESAGSTFAVMVGRLGSEARVDGTVANPLPEGLRGEQVLLPGSSMSTPQKFNDFWKRNGGEPVFGYPITPVLYSTTPDGKTLAVQYFERACLEYHPESANTASEVQLTDLGRQVYEIRHGNE